MGSASDPSLWRNRLQSVLRCDKLADGTDALSHLAALAAQLQKLAFELLAAGRTAAAAEEDLKKIILQNLFGEPGMVRSSLSSSHAGVVSNIHSADCMHTDGSPHPVYTMAATVGEGTYGSVCKATHKTTGQLHAVKTVPKWKIKLEELWSEISVVKQMDHPHILRLYATFEDAEAIYMATEICAGGEFFDTIERVGRVPELPAPRLVRQILSAVIYVHGKGFCHRDLKPENFLVSKQCGLEQIDLKLIDFGTAKSFKDGKLVTKVCTANYVAPEVLKRGEIPYTEKVDLWSCGVIVFMMLSGKMPFDHENNLELMKLVKKGKYDFTPEEVWDELSDEVQDLVRSLLCVKVPERLSAREAYKHQWFSMNRGRRTVVPFQEDELLQAISKFLSHNRLKRVALHIIARQVEDEGIASLRQLFIEFDSDHSGTLTMDEMERAFRMKHVSEDNIGVMKQMMQHMDEDQSGEIEYTEFIAALMTPDLYLQEGVCKMAFTQLDADKDGVISRADLNQLISGSGSGVLQYRKDMIQHIMHHIDDDGDGILSWAEFMQLMKEDSQKTRRKTAMNFRPPPSA